MAVDSLPPTLVGLLCTTLEQIETSGEVDVHDPAFAELKRSITRAIAEFEVAKTSKSVEPPLLEPSALRADAPTPVKNI